MSVVKAVSVAFVRFRVPDLARQHAFLTDFGMVGEVNGERLFMRGTGTNPFLYSAETGDAGFTSVGFCVPDRAALEALAKHDSGTVEPLDAPGGGWVVRLTDPDGFVVEAVAEQQAVKPIATTSLDAWNTDGNYPRVASSRRTAAGPAHIMRLGHVVLGVTNFRRSESWYKERFGLLTSDEIQPAPGVAIGAFMRTDCGDEPSDHHTLFLLERPGAPAGFMHAAFEIANVDDLMVGHDHLAAQGHTAQWGVGRHILGSQIFDYWLDPWGQELEHYTDGDRLRASDGAGIGSIEQLMGVQWGMPMPPLPTAPEA